MARSRKTPTSELEHGFDVPDAETNPGNPEPAVPAADAEGFDVSRPSQPPEPPPAIQDEEDETDDAEETPAPPRRVMETPEQRRLMRQKRIAKAEEEQLRRLVRHYPVVARLVQENERLNKLFTETP